MVMEGAQEKAEVVGSDGGGQWPRDSMPEGAKGVCGGRGADVDVVEIVGGEGDIT